MVGLGISPAGPLFIEESADRQKRQQNAFNSEDVAKNAKNVSGRRFLSCQPGNQQAEQQCTGHSKGGQQNPPDGMAFIWQGGIIRDRATQVLAAKMTKG